MNITSSKITERFQELAESIAGLPESVQITPGLDIMPQTEHSQPEITLESEPDSPLARSPWPIPITSSFSFERAKQPAFGWPSTSTPKEESQEVEITPSISKKSKKKKKETPA